jgi:hypothetical protein
MEIAIKPLKEGAFSFSISVSTNDPVNGHYEWFVVGTAVDAQSGDENDTGCTAEGGHGVALRSLVMCALTLWLACHVVVGGRRRTHAD